ncbi:hypothetical protein [Kribbella antibiotica]|nr:hypothetical protein [Kribbella antibiotica]
MRLRKLTAAAVAVVAVSAFVQTPAQAALPDPPTDVRLDWQGNLVHVTWKDQGEGNRLYIEYADLGTSESFSITRPSADNEIVKTGAVRRSSKARLAVSNYSDAGSSLPAYSEWFDTQVPSEPWLQEVVQQPDRSVKLTYTVQPVEDTTPNDPLDQPDSLIALTDGPDADDEQEHQLGIGSPWGVVPPLDGPVTIGLIASSGWGSAYGPRDARVGTVHAGFTVPAQQVYANRLAIKGTLKQFMGDGAQRATGIPVELQARASSTAPWKTYGRYTGNTTTAFDTGIAALGNRQYRLWVPAQKSATETAITVIPATSTSAKSSVTLAKFTTAGFTPSTARAGATVKLSVKIQPASTVQGVLQRWDGKKWINGTKIQLKNGTALIPIKASGRAATSRYRVALGPIVFNGLHLNATQSPTFTLTVR